MRPPVLVGLSLAGSLMLSACASDPVPQGLPPVTSAPTATAIPTPSSTPTPAPATTPSPPPQTMDADGASAFARFYYDVYNAALASGDVGQLASISDSSCITCLAQRDTLTRYAESRTRTDGRRVTVQEAIAPGGEDSMPLVTVVLTTAAGKRVDAEGTVEQFPEQLAKVTMQLSWQTDSWRVFRIFFDE